MRIAILADIHGNRCAFDAVVAHMRETSPDLILHGGDLADSGSSPKYVLDRIRDFAWPGVVGNTDEMLFAPNTLTDFAQRSPQLKQLFTAVAKGAEWTRELLQEDDLMWLSELPRTLTVPEFALLHASPETAWSAPGALASDADLKKAYESLPQPLVVYAHIHQPYVRNLPQFSLVNTGSVGLPYDGDRRASYLLMDDLKPSIRRVEYDVDKEIAALLASGMPNADWIARMLSTGRAQMP